MAKRLTPIERAIAGPPVDRQQRYWESVQSKGLKRVSVIVPFGEVDRLKAFARELRSTFEADRGADHD